VAFEGEDGGGDETADRHNRPCRFCFFEPLLHGLFAGVVIGGEFEGEKPESEHLRVASGEQGAGGNERWEHETGKKLGAEEKHDDGNEDAGSKKAVVNTKLGGGFIKGGVDFEECSSSGSHSG